MHERLFPGVLMFLKLILSSNTFLLSSSLNTRLPLKYPTSEYWTSKNSTFSYSQQPPKPYPVTIQDTALGPTLA